MRALEINRRRQMKKNRDTQDCNSKEKGQPKNNTVNDPVGGTKEASEDRVWSIQAAAAETGPQESTGIRAKHSDTIKRVHAAEGKVDAVNNQRKQSTSKRTTQGKCFV